MNFKEKHSALKKIKRFHKKIRVWLIKLFYDRKKKLYEISPSKLKRILYLLSDDKIGDMLVNTFMFREIKNNYPDIVIDVVSGPNSKIVLKGNSNINHIYLFENSFLTLRKLGSELRKHYYDILILLSDSHPTKTLYLINKINATSNIGVNTYNCSIFDISLKTYDHPHITDRNKEILSFFNITPTPNDIYYDLFLDKKKDLEIKNSLKHLGIKICINKFGASKHRTISSRIFKEILAKTLTASNQITILLPDYKNKLKNLTNEIKNDRILIYPTESIEDIFYLVNNVDIVITPDTSFVHIAVALKKDLIALYNDKIKSFYWAPINSNSKIIVSHGPMEIDFINVNEIIEGISSFIKQREICN